MILIYLPTDIYKNKGKIINLGEIFTLANTSKASGS